MNYKRSDLKHQLSSFRLERGNLNSGSCSFSSSCYNILQNLQALLPGWVLLTRLYTFPEVLLLSQCTQSHLVHPWQQKFGLAKFLVGICFGSKEFGPKNFLAKNIWVGNLFGSKKFGSEIFLGQKNLGRKFGLAKFYFALIRFVCVMLLITAKLNNNNTEFLWVEVVVVGQNP